MMNLFTEMFSTKGRVNRQTFLFGGLSSLIGIATLPAFVRILGLYYNLVPDPKSNAYFFAWLIFAVFAFFISVLSLAAFALLTIKRQQDRDRNPLWLLLLPGTLFAWYLASYNELTFDPDQNLTPIGIFVRGTTAFVWLVILGDLCLFKGSPETNRFGPHPLTAQHSPLRALLRSPMPVRSLLLGFKGRINRAPYWIVTISSYVIAFGLLILAAAGNFPSLVDGDPATVETSNLLILIAIILLTILGLILFIYVQVTIMAKRLHDRNKSAWWLAFFYGAPLFLNGASEFLLVTAEELQSSGSEGANLFAYFSIALLIVWAGISLWFFIEFYFFKGTRGPNRFGPDPLGAKAADARL